MNDYCSPIVCSLESLSSPRLFFGVREEGRNLWKTVGAAFRDLRSGFSRPLPIGRTDSTPQREVRYVLYEIRYVTATHSHAHRRVQADLVP
jgi:hypothetical protein